MHDPNKPVPRGVYILPNLFTTASLFAGFFSIILAFKDQFDMAAWAILVGAAMDGLDGKVARLTGTGRVSFEDARALGLVGMAARSSAVSSSFG